MRILGSLRELRDNEDGSFLVNAIILGIAIAIIAVFVIDGASVYYTWQSANEVTTEAAREAAFVYQDTGSDARAERAAIDVCEENGMEIILFRMNRNGHTYDVSCAKDADTIVYKHIPVFSDLVHQEAKKSTENL